MHVSPVKCSVVTEPGLFTGELVFEGEAYKSDKIQFYSRFAIIFMRAIECLHLDCLFDVRTIEITDVTGKTFALSRKSAFLWLKKHGDSRYNTEYRQLDHVNFGGHNLADVLRPHMPQKYLFIADLRNELVLKQFLKKQRDVRNPATWSLADRQLESTISQIKAQLSAL